jgi:hypothetical protein
MWVAVQTCPMKAVRNSQTVESGALARKRALDGLDAPVPLTVFGSMMPRP